MSPAVKVYSNANFKVTQHHKLTRSTTMQLKGNTMSPAVKVFNKASFNVTHCHQL